MSHLVVKTHLDEVKKSLESIQAERPGVKYILSETGSALGGAPARFAAGFGSALWSVDFNLAAMARGVARVVDSGRPAAKHDSWVPDGSVAGNPGPLVRAAFAADPMVADFVGREPSAVVEARLSHGSPHLSAYASYRTGTGRPRKVALVNLHLWNKGDGERPVIVFAMPVDGSVESVRVRRLHANAGAEAMGYDVGGYLHNVTWAGEQWS